MAKFLLATSSDGFKDYVKLSNGYGYRTSGIIEKEKYLFVSFHKLSFNNENYLAIGEDFVSVVGTVVYKDAIGKESLRKIYDDFDGNINHIRNEIIGNGAFIIKKGNKIKIFCEYLGFYNIFYSYNHNRLIVSNELYDVCQFCSNLEIDDDNLRLKVLIDGVYGKDTEIKDVYCLQDCESITIDTNTGNFEIESEEVNWRNTDNLSYDEIVNKICDYLRTTAKTLYKHFGNPALSSTGGLDNRLNLAAFLSAGVQPDLYYGVGNSSVTNTFNGDLQIDRCYKKKYDLNLNVVSWKSSIPINKDWDYLANIYGLGSVVYAGSKDIYDNYLNIPNKLLLFGCIGEIYRIDDNAYLDEIGSNNFTLEEYVEKYIFGSYWSSWQLLFKNKQRIKKHAIEKLLPLCEKWGLNTNNLSSQDDIMLWLERMRRSDVVVPNLMNRHHFCLFLNTQYPIVKLLTMIAPKDKSKAKFHLDVLRNLYPSIMDVPVFSRCMYQTYNKQTNMLILPLKVRIAKYVKSILPLCVSDKLRIIKSKMKSNKKKEEDSFDSASILPVEELLSHYGLKYGVDYEITHLGRLNNSIIYYAQELFVLEKLGIKLRNNR